MYIHRTRPAYSTAELVEIYKVPHDHTQWEDHIHRVQETIAFGQRCIQDELIKPWVIDLSCGDAAIPLALDSNAILGDFAPGHHLQGPIEETLSRLPGFAIGVNPVFVMCETLEHLDNPYNVLRKINSQLSFRGFLLLSTPIHPPNTVDGNEQHYWTWDREGVEVILTAAGWDPDQYSEAYSGIGYRYGLWWCW